MTAEQRYIEQRLSDQIEWFDRKSMHNQKLYKRFRTAELILAALIPFLVGYALGSRVVVIVIGLIGVLITCITGLLSLYKFQENWINYRNTCEALKHEHFMYLAKAGCYETTKNPFYLLVERVEKIIGRENMAWTQLHKVTDKSGSSYVPTSISSTAS